MYGTLSISDLVTMTTTPITGNSNIEQRIYEAIEAELAVHNMLMQEKMAELVEETTEQIDNYGTTARMEMEEVSEYGQSDAQKVAPPPYPVGYPLRQYDVNIQWTFGALKNMTAADLAAQFTAATSADVRKVDREIRRALFRPTNYTFVDRFVRNAAIPVKALLNADGSEIPLDQNGLGFNGATHTHYLAAATLTATAVNSALETVTEHHPNGEPIIKIHRGLEDTFRALPDFTPYVDVRIRQPLTATYAERPLDYTNPNKRAIGIYKSAEVRVDSSLMPPGYLFCYVPTAPKTLRMRTRTAGSGGLVIAAEDERYPLRARTMVREMGLAAHTRTNGAILYIGGGSYVQPTIN